MHPNTAKAIINNPDNDELDIAQLAEATQALKYVKIHNISWYILRG